ncbi:MAG: hypothetical protein ABSA83_00175 [Verrucomicrobiota bacterium]
MKEETLTDELFGFFKAAYETEFARKDKLSDRINLGVTILTILGGLAAFYVSSFKQAPFSSAHLFFYVPLLSGIVLMAISLWQFGVAVAQGWDYHYVSDSSTLGHYVEDMRIQNAPVDETVEKQVRSKFLETVVGQYQVCATLNFYANAERERIFLRGLQFAMWSLALLLATSLPFFVLKGAFHDEPQKVSIVNPVEVQNAR